MFEFLCETTGCAGQPTFAAGVLAFADKPGVSGALGFPEGTPSIDVLTGASLLSNMKETFTNGTLGTSGPRHAEQRKIAESTASTMTGEGLNMASVTRVTGISSDVFKKGQTLARANAAADLPSEVISSVPISHQHSYPYQEAWKWFHDPECAGVEIDKQTRGSTNANVSSFRMGSYWISNVTTASDTALRRSLHSRSWNLRTMPRL